VILWLAEATSRIVGSCRWTCGLGGPHYGEEPTAASGWENS
jgi:hypothetical protein